MKNSIHRNIYQGNAMLPFIYNDGVSEKQLKISICAKNLSISAQTYVECLKLIGETPIIGPIDNTQYVQDKVHRKVEALFVKKAEPVIEVNEEKDLKKVIGQIEEKLKADLKISDKRNEVKFYVPAKLEELESIVNEVNNYLINVHSIDKRTGTEIIDVDF